MQQVEKWTPSGTVNTFRITLSDSDEPITVTNSVGDAIAYERANKVAWHQDVSAESMLWVAWRAARREGLTSEPQFDQFVPRVLNLEVAATADEDPTQTDPLDI